MTFSPVRKQSSRMALSQGERRLGRIVAPKEGRKNSADDPERRALMKWCQIDRTNKMKEGRIVAALICSSVPTFPNRPRPSSSSSSSIAEATLYLNHSENRARYRVPSLSGKDEAE